MQVVKDAIAKLPNAKEMWMNPNDEKKFGKELYELGPEVKTHNAMPEGTFYLTEHSIEEVINENLRRLYDWNE